MEKWEFLYPYLAKLNILAAAAIALGVFLITDASRRLVIRQLDKRRLTPPLGKQIQGKFASVLNCTSVFFEGALGVVFGSMVLEIPSTWEQHIQRGVVIVVILQVGIWSNAIVQAFIDSWMDTSAHPSDEPAGIARVARKNMVLFLSKAVIWVLTGLLVMDNIGINVNSLVTGLGFTTVAVGFATQNIVSDLFSSLSILLDKPFLVGDFIIAGDMKGTVEHIGLRTTRLKSDNGDILVITNVDLAKSRLTVNHRHPQIG